MINDKKTASLLKALLKLSKKDSVKGEEILETARIFVDADSNFLYTLIENGILETLEISEDIEDYSFRINVDSLKDKDKIKKLLERKVKPEDFIIIASYPEKILIKDLRYIEDLYPHICRLIMSAKERLIFINPYFDKRGLDKLLPYVIESAKRGVKIKLISRKEKGSEALLGIIKNKIKDNLEIKKFGGSGYFLHAKCIIADDKAAYIGSANITGTSLGSNLELGILFTGSKVKQLSQFLDKVLSLEGDEDA